MKQIFSRLFLAFAAVLVALALSSLAHAQQADDDPSPDRAQPRQQPSKKSRGPAQVPPSNVPSNSEPQTQDALAFTGIISRMQNEVVLRDPVTKMVYKFDDPSKLKLYVGRQVKVVGKLGLNSNTIHVNSIQVLPADEHRPE